ncbi:MAG: DUF192 domain-containing protein [Euryarchaeota archaeon]|nr:DUF192 domain-containing protein [Euryarchaeota archaeon]MBV1730061.1 DUF192 domain-containing protein [Methanobacterium sp.]MBU4547380.1 DUF192 domain-containing protein [Euryarchaeota archaeon]MBU4608907.1 DUF192 domain-containing protein [Euryarchaeota archaeon]MBV1755118.1 DUF192 domain-containing protein [Methanobacterium sp.]
MSSKMNLINQTQGKTIGPVEFADSFFSRFRGLMLKTKIESGLVLKIPAGRGKRGSAIHMFFMRMPLDVIFADENKKVVDIVSLEPWNTYTPQAPARYVIELEKGNLQKANISIGDHLEFKKIDYP